MEIRVLGAVGARRLETDEVKAVLAAGEGFVWADIPTRDPDGPALLSDVFGFDERAVADCLKRNTTARLHLYPDHVFAVLHVPDPGEHGHVHSIELDLFIGPNYVVTVHGPMNPVVPASAAQVEVGAVARRIDDGRWRPDTPADLVHAVLSVMNRRMDGYLADLRHETWELERRVTAGTLGDPEDFLEEMFQVRLGLQAVRTMAALNREVWARLARLKALGPDSRALMLDTVDQFKRVINASDVQRDHLQGVIDFYQTRINTKMTVAAERLAVIAAVTLPVTAVSSIVGMNVIVNAGTHWILLIILLVLMGAMSLWLLMWAKRQGWW